VWFELVGRIGAVKAATFHFLNPFLGVAISAIVLDEPFGKNTQKQTNKQTNKQTKREEQKRTETSTEHSRHPGAVGKVWVMMTD
jgi:hypothetical protein